MVFIICLWGIIFNIVKRLCLIFYCVMFRDIVVEKGIKGVKNVMYV